CCLVSALLFKSLFRSTLPYPRADYEYASYEIGDGWPTHELIPGIDLFSDRFRIDVRSVVGSLRFVLYELHRTGQYLLVSTSYSY
uniref:Uncharacterized protein n=1 Tax=Callorhinchus milii TaxID=7868 RepID=A0A4W3JT43_CALMI